MILVSSELDTIAGKQIRKVYDMASNIRKFDIKIINIQVLP